MSAYPLVPLSEAISSISTGKSIAAESRPAQGDEYGVLKLSAVTWGRFRPEENKAFFSGHVPDASITLRTGDLIMSRANTTELVGALVMVEDDYPNLALSDKTLRLVPDRERADARYVMYAMRQPSVRRYLEARATGTSGSMRNISQKNILATPIPLPPLPEQKRIAAILDKADEIRRKRAEAIKLTEELLRSAFLEMFGDPVTNPKGWEVKKLGEVISQIDAGWSVGGETRLPRDDEDAVLKISAVTSGSFLSDECKAVPLHDRDVPRPKRGDLLFSRANTRELVAATCLVEEDAPRRFLPDKLWRISTTDQVCAEYLRYVLSFRGVRYGLTRQATGTSGSMLNVSKAKLLGFAIPLPPKKLQDNYAKIVWKVYGVRRQAEGSRELETRLQESLTQRAFRGEI